jgi:hypothetical protein
MRVLIDECLNWRLGRALTGHYAVSAQKMGWSGVKNGRLLTLAVENGRHPTSPYPSLDVESSGPVAFINTGKSCESEGITSRAAAIPLFLKCDIFTHKA